MQDYFYVVISPFNNYKRGDLIKNVHTIKIINALGDNVINCRKVFIKDSIKQESIHETVLKISSIKDQDVMLNDDETVLN